MDDILDSIIPTEEDIQMMLSTVADYKRVRFDMNTSCQEVVQASNGEASEIWYSKQDIAVFKAHVAKLTTTCQDSSTRKGECQRGLDHFSKERNKTQVLARHCILQAFRKGCTSEELATLSSKCTSWHCDVARKQGSLDYSEVYAPPASVPSIPELISIPPQFSFTPRKRAVSIDESLEGDDQPAQDYDPAKEAPIVRRPLAVTPPPSKRLRISCAA